VITSTAQTDPWLNTEPEADPFNKIPSFLDDDGGMDEATPHVELLLIYEDDSTVSRARHAVEHVLSRPEKRAHYHIRPWNLDQLRQSKEYGQAIHDALAADIVVLSTHGKNGAGLDAAARLMQWVGLKRGTPCGLLISVQPVAELFTTDIPELNDLCAAATRNGMTVLFHAGEPGGSRAEMAMSDTIPDLLAAIPPQGLPNAAWSSQ
jgi:hypothetical protein